MLNLHHLELFYYVARHGGISRAVRFIPYGVQQPAVSGQILQLERHLGARLFTRVPFRLTAEGEELFGAIRPFFENLDAIENRLRSGVPLLRFAAAEAVLRDHLPDVLRRLRTRHPKLKVTLRSGYQPQLEAWLIERQVDLVVTAIEGRPLPGLSSRPLVALPLGLLVARRSAVRSAAQLWSRGRLEDPLICPHSSEIISRNFQRGLAARGLSWTPAITASSLETVARYVAEGYGIGLTVADGRPPPHTRLLPLHDFPALKIAALWAGKPSATTQMALEEFEAYVRRRWPRN